MLSTALRKNTTSRVGPPNRWPRCIALVSLALAGSCATSSPVPSPATGPGLAEAPPLENLTEVSTPRATRTPAARDWKYPGDFLHDEDVVRIPRAAVIRRLGRSGVAARPGIWSMRGLSVRGCGRWLASTHNTSAPRRMIRRVSSTASDRSRFILRWNGQGRWLEIECPRLAAVDLTV